MGISNFDVRLVRKRDRSYLLREDIVVNEVKYSLRDKSFERVFSYTIKGENNDNSLFSIIEGVLDKIKIPAEIGKKYIKTVA